MKRPIVPFALAGALLAVTLGCGSTTPLTPSTPAPTATVAPKLTAPSAQAPVNGQIADGLTPTLTAAAASVDVTTYVLQYRFQLFNSASVLALDSGLVDKPTWTTPVSLTPKETYTWQVRAETQGFLGPWSNSATFTAPDAPPAFRGPIGDWQSCGSLASNMDRLVGCVWNAVHPVNSVGDLEVVKRVAWLVRGQGGGLLIKGGGDNVVLWQGYSLSASRMCYADGHIYKLIVDAGPGGQNGPEYADNGFVDKSLYVAAIDPSKP